MKFKVGDKVVLRKGERDFVDSMLHYVGSETIITHIHNNGGFIVENNCWTWYDDSLELTKEEPQEYFYVGQTVYSPLFQNKERKAVITSINKSLTYQILCEGDNVEKHFALDGRYSNDHDFVSLFQEPIQFPVNKPIERFEEGEIVECSNNNDFWGLGYFVGFGDNSARPYKVCTVKDDKKESDSVLDYAKIRKIR